jgi:predicted lipid-binding transport protein (Tim44 family)
MKKGLLTMLALAVFFAFSASAVDAKPRGGIKSPKQSFTQTPSKPADNVTQSNPGTKSTSSTAGATTTANRGFFSGGSFMKGLMIGGLAGMLFGGLFGNLGFFGDLLGLIINLLAIFVLFSAIRAIFIYFKNRRKPTHPDNRRTF